MAAATCAEIVRKKFPAIDEEMFNYVNGILESGAEDFETASDVFDAVGDLFLEMTENCEDDVNEICSQLINILKLNNSYVSGQPTKLNTPVQLKEIVNNIDTNVEELGSIWLQRKDENRETVDSKKLEKAEAKMKAKQDKKLLKEKSELATQSDCYLDNASVSHTINKRSAQMDKVGFTKDVFVEDIDLAFGDRSLLKNANLILVSAHRYGLIGRNGVGKTTLLRAISRRELRISQHLTILHVEQEVVGDDTIALDSVLECDVKRTGLLKEEKSINTSLQTTASPSKNNETLETRLAEVYAELEEMEADKAPARASVILAGLGFSTQMQNQKTREFSGGWRMRLALARALFSKPDLLLLDEPTNMLDLNAIIWLEDYLQKWPSTLLVVSHDRNFLDSVCSDIIHMHTSRLDCYKGNYESFIKTKTERLKNQQREYEAQKEYRNHIQVFINRFRYNANRAALVQSKIKMLEKLPELTPVEKETEVILRFPECEDLSPPILQLDEVHFYYSKEKTIFGNVSMSANMQSRIAIVGENGAGKTTLLKILLGDLTPVKGVRHVHRNLKIGYFSQHHVDQLTMNKNSLELLQSKFPGKPEEEYRRQLGSFGVSGELALRPIDSLSGGQKSRVAFAILGMTRPNFFILDEPTNHLDMESIEALGKALGKFKGGVILVSHDERLVRTVCNEIWLCGSQAIRSIEGGFVEYRRILENEFKRL